MEECNPKVVPANANSRLTKQMCPNSEGKLLTTTSVPYREAIGSLMHITVLTRPDIAFAVGQVSQFPENPGPPNWRAVKRIYAYLAGTNN